MTDDYPPMFEEDNGAYRLRVWYLKPLERWRLDLNLSGLAPVQSRTLPVIGPVAAGIEPQDMVVIREAARAMFAAMINAR